MAMLALCLIAAGVLLLGHLRTTAPLDSSSAPELLQSSGALIPPAATSPAEKGNTASANTETLQSAAEERPVIRNRPLQELIDEAKNQDPVAGFREFLESAQPAPMRDGSYWIAGSGNAHSLAIVRENTPMDLRLADSGVMRGDANPLVRLNGPGGRWTFEAFIEDGEVRVRLPADSVREGVYTMDVNPHQPRTTMARRYLLQLVKSGDKQAQPTD